MVSQLISLLPISSYPVTRAWHNQKLVTSILAVCSIVVYIGLSIWNILTQGKEPVYTSQLMPRFIHGENTTCQPVELVSGNVIYSSPNGAFTWTITGIDNGASSGFEVGVNYAAAKMQANVTSLSLTYLWSMQDYQYSVCANVTIPRVSEVSSTGQMQIARDMGGSQLQSVVMMCSTFDLTMSQVPVWAVGLQNYIQSTVYDLSGLFQRVNITHDSMPLVNFPPYGNTEQGSPPKDREITPANAYDLTAWLSGVRFLPTTTGKNYSSTVPTTMAPQHQLVLASNDTPVDLNAAFQATYHRNGSGVSGMNIGVTGIGAVHLLTEANNAANGYREPKIVTDVRSTALGIMNTLGDAAINDLNNRIIGASYLCTVTTSKWKPPLTLLAMVLANNAALFGAYLAASVAIARRWDHRHAPRDIKYERTNSYALAPSPVFAYAHASYASLSTKVPEMAYYDV